MKKVVSIALVLVMMLVCASTAFAAPFVNSPTASGGPALVSFTNEDEACTAKIIITAYRDRATLPQEKQELLEKGYRALANGTVDALGADAAVSDLFDVSFTGCDNHAEHGSFTITLKADGLKNFAGLLHYNGSAWELVKGAKVNDAKTELTFTCDSLSPFAIAVQKGASGNGSSSEPTSPQTDDYSVYFLAAGAFFALCAAAFLAVSRKKNLEK